MTENFACALWHWPVPSLVCCSLIPQDLPTAAVGPSRNPGLSSEDGTSSPAGEVAQ